VRKKLATLTSRTRPLLLLLLLPALLSCGLVAQNSGPARDAWQHPQRVMDALGVGAGSAVADVGCGPGYFTFHLAERVGPAGHVYAVDIDEGALTSVRQRASRDDLGQIETIRGDTDDPHLPSAGLDAALIVNAYHEMREYDAMLAGIYRALKPGGRLGVIDGAIEPGNDRSVYYRRHRIPSTVVRADAARAGFRFRDEEPGFTRNRDNREFYFLVFEKPSS
jgi:predicted methyltransferase